MVITTNVNKPKAASSLDVNELIISLFFYGFNNSLLNAAGNFKDANKTREATNTVSSFFNDLMNGDLNGIKQYISKEYYHKNRTLLDDNKEYPNFLKEYYQGAKMNLLNIYMAGDNIMVDIEILFPNQTKGVYVIHLRQEDNISWKVIEVQ